VAAAERAPEGQKKPVEGCFKGIPVAYASEIDGSAMWAPWEQHTLQYLDQVGINEQQQPCIVPTDSERWNQILRVSAALSVSTVLPSSKLTSNSSCAWLLFAPCHCVQRFPHGRNTKARF
jgi:hypothetical protein